MSVTKTVLIAVSLVLGLTTLASATPRSNTSNNGYTYNTEVAGKAQQDHFAISN